MNSGTRPKAWDKSGYDSQQRKHVSSDSAGSLRGTLDRSPLLSPWTSACAWAVDIWKFVGLMRAGKSGWLEPLVCWLASGSSVAVSKD